MTAYAINPFKGSEDGMGWNFAYQAAKQHKVTVITRVNNQKHIEQYINESNLNTENLKFEYFDLPYILRFWKRGGKGAMLYFYLWQFCMPWFILTKGLKSDIVHNLNFHNDWTPTFLWLLKRPLVWGPVGHHPLIPKAFILKPYGWMPYLKDRLTWLVKFYFWNISPSLAIAKICSTKVLAMNSGVNKVWGKDNRISIMPSVACAPPPYDQPLKPINKSNNQFNVLSAGRFVPLKGWDVTIKAFALFYNRLSQDERKYVKLTLVGSGPIEKKLIQWANNAGLEQSSYQIINWLPRNQLLTLYSLSSIFLFPSHEGAGMVVAEAMSYGLPVLCFDNEGPGELIGQNTGIKIPYGPYDETIERFANELFLLYRNPEHLLNLSNNAIQHFNKHLSWDTRGQMLANIYAKMIKNNTI